MDQLNSKQENRTPPAHELVQSQRDFFQSGGTRSLAFRQKALRKLQTSLLKHENDINQAVKEDLNKSPFETYMTETGIVLSELRFLKKHLPRWIRERRVRTPLVLRPATSFIVPEPYGVALIMSPWNYPVQLTLNPLVASMAAGNCSIVKPSAYAPATSRMLAGLLGISSRRNSWPWWKEAGRRTGLFWKNNLTSSFSPEAPRSAGWSWKRPPGT